MLMTIIMMRMMMVMEGSLEHNEEEQEEGREEDKKEEEDGHLFENAECERRERQHGAMCNTSYTPVHAAKSRSGATLTVCI